MADSGAQKNLEKMKYVRLGKTGLQVSRLTLGMMSYGDKRWAEWVIEEEDALPIIKYAWDSGINFWDTANVYSNGISEIITGHALTKYNIPRDRVVIATKVFSSIYPEDIGYRAFGAARPGVVDMNRGGLSRKEVESSLKRLGTDYIDLYQIHRYDNETPIEETMRALDDLVRIGKVRYLGASSMYAWQFSKAQYTAKLNGWTPFVSMREMIPLLQDQGVGMIPWSPLARGVLTGKNRQSVRVTTDPGIKRFIKTTEDVVVDRCVELSEKKKLTPSQVALAWMYTKPYVTSPIVGVSKTKYIDDLVGALEVKLNDDEIKFLEDAYTPRRVAGHI
ncbi:oxidoreductase [Gonapodya prolifera JEL478]|uniref:Oxidoreductase n=1 Tax=Gonapodya prolifera (strain JEL478) TaxID=1344416 RepID=A0A139APR9_GONPJ|nr:oxidoreductase [Gonapodya prolifera JEL478]|eukprot:KXS18751.1 oxidoreductase [Gonapodya prolifera JEL478]